MRQCVVKHGVIECASWRSWISEFELCGYEPGKNCDDLSGGSWVRAEAYVRMVIGRVVDVCLLSKAAVTTAT